MHLRKPLSFTSTLRGCGTVSMRYSQQKKKRLLGCLSCWGITSIRHASPLLSHSSAKTSIMRWAMSRCSSSQRKMPGVVMVDLCSGHELFDGISASRRKNRVTISPDYQRGGLSLSQVSLPLRVQRWFMRIAGLPIKQFVASDRDEPVVNISCRRMADPREHHSERQISCPCSEAVTAHSALLS